MTVPQQPVINLPPVNTSELETSIYSNLTPCVPNNVYLSIDPQTSNANTGVGYQGLLRKRSGSRAVTSRARYSAVKSIIAEPPCANKEEIAKARFKLKPSNTSSLSHL